MAFANATRAVIYREDADRWFVPTCLQATAKYRLFCFPYAGGGCSVFSGWREQFHGVDVKAVQLPGRESRFRDPPIADFEILLDQLEVAISGLLDRPYVFFGHSLGGLIAFELSKRLQQNGMRQPAHLIISGKQSIGAKPRRKPICDLPDEEFIQELKKYAGTPDEILASKELMALFLPMLRADVALFDRYKPRARNRLLSCPITVLGGDDDPFVLVEDLHGWHQETSGNFEQIVIQGDHFFINSKTNQVVGAVRNIIDNLNA